MRTGGQGAGLCGVVVRQEDWVGGDDEVLAVMGPYETEAAAQLAVMTGPRRRG